jgi:hypothetical protein
MGSRRRSSAPSLLVLLLLAPLLSLLGAPSPTAAATSSATAPAAVRATAAAAAPLVGRAAPGPRDDFPRLPDRCYEPDRETILVQPCRITRVGSGRPLLVAWGDSHAHMYLPALRRLARAQRVNLTMITLGSCPAALPLPARRGFGRSICENRNLDVLDYLRREDRRRGDDLAVLVGGFWSGYRDAYRRQRQADRTGAESGLSSYQQHMSTLAVEGGPRMFRRLGRLGLAVDLIGQAATVPLDARPCPAGEEPYRCVLPRDRALDREAGNRRWINRNLRAPLVGRPRLVDTTPAYCTATRCRPRVGGRTTFYDDIHLGARLAGTLTGYFAPVLRDLR